MGGADEDVMVEVMMDAIHVGIEHVYNHNNCSWILPCGFAIPLWAFPLFHAC